MAHYFSLPHLGAGSPEVESLGCYFFRLARAHDCTPWQLIRHLRAWSEANHVEGKWPHLPNSLLNKSMAMCGYGAATDRIASALVRATNVRTLRSGTLLSLRDVAARSALRTLRPSRAWCPACYAEDLQATGEPYDRLLWALVPLRRCSIHRLTLVDRCPACHAQQLYGTPVKTPSECSSCGHFLAGTNDHPVLAPVPTQGEKLIYELIGASACKPDLTLHWSSITAFYETVRPELSPNHPLTTRTSFRRHGAYPTLDSLIELCTTFSVSLVDFQTPEAPALTLPLYGPENRPAANPRHPRRSPTTHVQVQTALNDALTSGCPLPPFREFCERLGTSKGYVSYRFPTLARTYLCARRIARDDAQQTNILKATQMLKSSALWQAYIKNGMCQQKILVRKLSSLAGVTITVARKVVAACEREQVTVSGGRRAT